MYENEYMKKLNEDHVILQEAIKVLIWHNADESVIAGVKEYDKKVKEKLHKIIFY